MEFAVILPIYWCFDPSSDRRQWKKGKTDKEKQRDWIICTDDCGLWLNEDEQGEMRDQPRGAVEFYSDTKAGSQIKGR